MATIELNNESEHEFNDISSEVYRTYYFPNGEQVKISQPQFLAVSKSGGHRILDAQGVSHYIPPRWIHLAWTARYGEPHFVF